MCSQYWNLEAEVKCPECGRVFVDNLQTHFMGQIESCQNTYQLGQNVPELQGVSVVLDGRINDFIGTCECGAFFDVAARIHMGKVMNVWVLPKRP